MNWFKGIRVEDLPLFLAKIIPYVCLFAIALALVLTVALGEADFLNHKSKVV